MLFDFAAVESPLSDSLVLDHNPGWKRRLSAPRHGPLLRRPGSGTSRPKHDK